MASVTCKINIYCILGQKVYSDTNVYGKVEFDISDQPQGIYFIKLEYGDKIEVQRIIKYYVFSNKWGIECTGSQEKRDICVIRIF